MLKGNLLELAGTCVQLSDVLMQMGIGSIALVLSLLHYHLSLSLSIFL